MAAHVVYTLTALVSLIVTTTSQRIQVYDVKEEAPVSTFIADLSDLQVITSLDQADQDSMGFRTVSQGNPHESLFSLETEGILRTGRRIDREELCPNQRSCILDLVVIASTSSTASPFFKQLTIGIQILDDNDHTPMFTPDTEMRSIPENTAVGQSVRIPLADDPDSPDNGVGEYRLVSGGPTFRLKTTKDSEGVVTDVYLVLNQTVDREIRDLYRCVVAAYDLNDPSKTGTLAVEVQITDVDDHAPEFNKDVYPATMREDSDVGDTVTRVRASDPDDGNNGIIIYGFSAQTPDDVLSLFTINNMTGEVRLVSELDYEKQSSYSVVVTARGLTSHWLPGEAKLELQVLDVNDNPPHVTVDSVQGESNVTVTENQPDDTLLAYVLVSDRDDSGQQVVDCYLTSDQFVLQQDSPSAYLFYTRLSMDREVQDEYQVILSCRDRGSPSLTTLMQISIIVTDVNDNEPEFEEDEYQVAIVENTPPDVNLISVLATDPDAGPNGTVRYTLDPQLTRLLQIDPSTGVLSTKAVLDYEEKKYYSGYIIATDQGSPPSSASAKLEILITDVNDIAPHFSQEEYYFRLDENLPGDAFVGQVSASDVENPSARDFYFRRSPDSGDLFSVNADTGSIYTNQKLDREMTDSHTITLYVIDKQDTSLSSSVSVIITVTDVNDNDPYITYPSNTNDTIHVSSHAPLGYEVLNIQAEDVDNGDNGTVVFLLVAGNDGSYFSLDRASGMLKVEKHLNHITQKTFEIKILVSDSGHPPRNVPLDLVIVVNNTLDIKANNDSAVSPTDAASSSSNLSIVIGVLVGSLILIIILVVAIVIVRTQEIRRRKRQKYVSTLFQQQIKHSCPDQQYDDQDKTHPRDPCTDLEQEYYSHPGNSFRSNKSFGTAPSTWHQHQPGDNRPVDQQLPKSHPCHQPGQYPQETSQHVLALNPSHLARGASCHRSSSKQRTNPQSAANQCNPDVSNRTSGSRLRRGESVHRTPAVDGDSLSAHSDVSVADSGRGSHEDSSSSPCAGEADQSFTRENCTPQKPPHKAADRRKTISEEQPALPPREPRSFRGHQGHRRAPAPVTSSHVIADSLVSHKHRLNPCGDDGIRSVDYYPTGPPPPYHHNKDLKDLESLVTDSHITLDYRKSFDSFSSSKV